MSLLRDLSLTSQTLVTVIALLMVLVAWEVYVFQGRPEVIASGERIESSKPELADLSSTTFLPKFLSLSTYSDVIQRTLFLAARKPPAAQAAAETIISAEQLAKQWRLTGIVLTKEDTIAILQRQRDKQALRLEIGMSLEGWTLDAIGPTNVALVTGTNTVTLELYERTQSLNTIPPRPPRDDQTDP